MQVSKKNLSPTKVELTITADQESLDNIKDHVLSQYAKSMSITGFRKGHAPKPIVEKNIDPATLQAEFLEHAVNDLYTQAATEQNLRPVSQADVSVTKFVPFTTLEFVATTDVIGKITLPDYKKIKMSKQVEATTDKDITAVLDDLRRRDSVRREVTRASKEGDELVIDFDGVDAKTKEPIEGASGQDYPITLGSNTFIPGFEPELVGLKTGESKTFDITFPADYSNVDLQEKKVTFTIKVKAVRELTLPKIDDEFAAKIGPFKTVAELKADIKKQLRVERDAQAQRKLENDLLAEIAEQSKADIPTVLVDEEIVRMEEEERRNLMYRGQTWQEHLKAEGKTEEEHHEGLRESAEIRVKTGLVLGELAEVEGITFSATDLDKRIQGLKQQYSDPQMRAELDKPENRRELGGRLLTELTVERLVGYATAK